MNGVQRSAVDTALLIGIVAAIAWGTLAFGAVYPWAYWPLAIGCAAIGGAALAAGRRDRPPLVVLTLTLAVVAVAIACQLVPLPGTAIALISPAADTLTDPLISSAANSLHPLSIAPGRTTTALGLFAAFAIFLLGSARLTSNVGAQPVATCMSAFGVLLALIGIAGYAASSPDAQPLIYGFWKPLQGGRPFGPFVNPNHFAGWMLMVIPLALATAAAALMGVVDRQPLGTPDRMGWVNSGQFAVFLLSAGAYIVLGLSLLMTRSRSALIAFGIGTAVLGFVVARRQRNAARTFAVGAIFTVMLVSAAAWAGVDNVLGKFAKSSEEGVTLASGRLGVWKDTAEIAGHFPLAGTGINTYGVAMMLYQSGARAVQYQQAHNDYLQLAAEGGLLVGGPVLLAIGIFIRDVRRRFREAPKQGTTYWLRVGAVVGLISIALQSLVEFSLQMPGNAAVFALVAGIALHRSPNLGLAHADHRDGM